MGSQHREHKFQTELDTVSGLLERFGCTCRNREQIQASVESPMRFKLIFRCPRCWRSVCPLSVWTLMRSWIPPEIRWLFHKLRPFLRWHLFSFLCISLGSFLALLTPLVLKWVIDVVLPSGSSGLLTGAVLLTLLCYQGRTVLTASGAYLTVHAAQRLALELRLALLKHLDRLSADYHESTAVGASMYSLQDPIEEISYFGSDLVPSILRTMVASVLTMGTMAVLNVRLTLTILPLIPVFLLARRHFRSRLESESDCVQRERATWNSFLQEHLASIIAVQLLGMEQRQERAAFRHLAGQVRALNSLFKTGVSFTFFTSLTIGLGIAGVVAYGGWSVLKGTLTMGGLVAFYSYVTQLFEPLSGVADTYVRAQSVLANIRQVRAVMNLEPTVTNQPGAIKFPDAKPWSIELTSVHFQYPGNRGHLSIPHLCIPAGETVAVVGENGAGKSTFAKLLARFYDVHHGSISVAGCDIRNIEIASLREYICYVPPYPLLFDTTIAGNLRLGRLTASPDELEDVLESVGLAGWRAGLRERLKHRVGPLGAQISGGQRQRIGLARAILQRPRVLILDEATSSLDTTSEQTAICNLRKHLPDSTIILISHRLSAMSAVERAILLEAGRIIEDDSPTVLLAERTAFSGIFNSFAPSAKYRDATPRTDLL